MIKRRGCFGCHEIPGMEKEMRIAPELTTFGNKRLLELEFGDSEIEHSWDAWTMNKLKNTSIYRTERVLDKMPNFNLNDEDIEALMVFLKSLTNRTIQKEFYRGLNQSELWLENGRRLINKFNCRGCHIIEGNGGYIAKYYTSINDAPPILEKGALHEGEKVQGAWLFAFLKKPEMIRPWLKIRMPTFYFTDEEVTTIARYFAVLAKKESIYDYIEQREIKEEYIKAAKRLTSEDHLDCFQCHFFGSKKPSGLPSKWAPNLANVKKRLKPDWIIKWLRDPSSIQPQTKMPSFFVDEEEVPKDILDGDKEKQIEALMEFLIHYNTT